jgi:hypothetical protein
LYAQRHEITRDRRKIQTGTGGHDDRVRERQFLGVVCLLSDLIIGFFVAYLTAHTVAPGATDRAVFRVTGTTAFMAYGLGNLSNSIWKGQPWSMTIKEVIDGLVYALLTAGTFGWLCPR